MGWQHGSKRSMEFERSTTRTSSTGRFRPLAPHRKADGPDITYGWRAVAREEGGAPAARCSESGHRLGSSPAETGRGKAFDLGLETIDLKRVDIHTNALRGARQGFALIRSVILAGRFGANEDEAANFGSQGHGQGQNGVERLRQVIVQRLAIGP